MEFKTDIEPGQLDKIINRLVSQNFIERGERLLMISSRGMDYIFKSAPKKYVSFSVMTRNVLSILKSEKEKVTPKILLDRIGLNMEQIDSLVLSVWYLREKGLVKMGEREFLITSHGLNYIENWDDDTSLSP